MYYLLRVEEELEQLDELFVAGMERTVAIEAAHEYLLRSWPKTATINFFFILFFFLFIAAYIRKPQQMISSKYVFFH